VDVDREGRRFERREAVVVVGRVEELQVQHRQPAVGVAGDPHRAAGRLVVIGQRPAARSGDHGHAVGPQGVELAGLWVAGRLQVSVAGRLQAPEERLHQVGAALLRIGPVDEALEGMIVGPLAIDEHGKRRGGGGLGDHADAAIGDGVLGEPFRREGAVVAGRPLRPTAGGQGDQPRGARVFALWRGVGRAGFEEGHGDGLRCSELRTNGEQCRVVVTIEDNPLSSPFGGGGPANAGGGGQHGESKDGESQSRNRGQRPPSAATDVAAGSQALVRPETRRPGRA
jgi:hypothetical protein